MGRLSRCFLAAPRFAVRRWEPEATAQWHDHAFFIPAEYFAALWAVGLISLGVWAAIKNQRAVVNTVTTFAAIHFYTQWFERLNTSAAMVIAAGAIAVGGTFLLWRYNRKGSLAAAPQTG